MGSIRKHGQTGALFFDFQYQGCRRAFKSDHLYSLNFDQG